ncbi:hypothetical protein Rsub_06211 [Raphidocelis subcapitata]|uniref:NAD(+) diphosphatase n=1 Tax=Raphidocelis subcapitata TaxID=307507 RepID=A0A2V0P4X3_9CHLO|nr:hypothetical protein Rsub_06211 [Raphidocelis subcapitata]|eukprot:GBF93962.1 hypothetical protein Rsub_06211 [Raphidocelis subcapitata]
MLAGRHCPRLAGPARSHWRRARRAAAATRAAAAGAGSGDAAPAPAAAPAAAAPPPESDAQGAGPIFYSAYPLDRAAHLRHDEARLQQLLAQPAARLLPVCGGRVLVTPAAGRDGGNGGNGGGGEGGGAAQRLAWVVPAADALAHLDPSVPPLLLGLDAAGAPHFGGHASLAGADALAAAAAPGARWAAARGVGPELDAGEAALAATAAGLTQWHLSSLYAGATGEATEGAEGGFARRVPSTGRSVYPRIDPAIITLVTAGDWALLGRKAEWPAGRYSTLAGFLEVGETLEQALVREVLEESAVRVAPETVRYVASQPWPFPRSLMVGFAAEAEAAARGGGGRRGLELLGGPGRGAAMDVGLRPWEVEGALLPRGDLEEPVPQPGEMEDVRWFHRDWIRAAMEAAAAGSSTDGSDGGGGDGSSGGGGGAPDAGPGARCGDFGGFQIPGPYSLAHRLITGWLDGGGGGGNGGCGDGEAWAGDAVPQVSIGAGTFKYVLLRVRDADGGAADGAPPRSKLLVWGHPHADYHNHIHQRAKGFASRLGLACDVLGGGRIEHRPDQREICVYGYSAAFGPAPHEVAAALLKRWFPLYGAGGVTISYDGY